MIARINLPSGKKMEFKYDSLGRRVYKKEYTVTENLYTILTKGIETTYVYGAGSNPIMVMEEKFSNEYEDLPEIHNPVGDPRL